MYSVCKDALIQLSHAQCLHYAALHRAAISLGTCASRLVMNPSRGIHSMLFTGVPSCMTRTKRSFPCSQTCERSRCRLT